MAASQFLRNGRKAHRPRVPEVFAEYLPTGKCGFIVVETTTDPDTGLVTTFRAGLYPQRREEIQLYVFKLGPDGEWKDLALKNAKPPVDQPHIEWAAWPWELGLFA